jgi:hypothetical protein
MKQTAVEWFQDQIIKIVNGTCELSEIQIFNQAKEMEKQQMINYHKHLIEKFTKLEYTFNTDPEFILENYKKTEQ